MDRMEIQVVIGILVVAGAIIAYILGVVMPRKHQSRKLQKEFGPEYDRTIGRFKDRARAEADLKERKERVSNLQFRRLSEAERARYMIDWERIQARFVDEPAASIREANTLVAEVMLARGYPVRDFETQASDLSVSYPVLAENYRLAHAIYLRNEQGHSNTEELRQAVVFYRGIFSELLEEVPLRRIA
jgi:hypothetical protein